MFSRFKTPLIAALLAIIPYFLFLGATNTVTVNGATVTDDRFNLLGVILALIGLGLVVSVLRPSAPKDTGRKLAAALAGVLCVLQLAASLDLVRPLDWFNSESDLPPLAYSQLSEGNRGIVADIVASGDVDAVARDLIVRAGFMLDNAHQHMAYADVCHDGRYRIDYDELVALPDVLPEEDQAEIVARAEGMRRPVPEPDQCSPSRDAYAMGELVDNINQQRDMIAILRDGYIELTR